MNYSRRLLQQFHPTKMSASIVERLKQWTTCDVCLPLKKKKPPLTLHGG